MIHEINRARPVAAVLAALAIIPALAFAGTEQMTFDIAEDGTRFVFDEEHLFEDGLPAYGNVFTTQGYIYPAGTLTCVEGGCDGVLEDGSPEFPDKVLGEWTCWGTHVGDGARTVTGPWVITTQQFDLGRTVGSRTVVTSGYELVDLDEAIQRAIVGGTGRYSTANGRQIQKLLGFNPSFGVGLQVHLSVRTDEE